MTDSLPGQLKRLWPLTCKIKFKVKGYYTGYRLEITSACVPKWSQATASFPGQITQPWPLAWHLTLSLTLKVKWQVKGYGSVSFPERLAVTWDHFGAGADVISGQYLVPNPLTLNLVWKAKYQVKGHACVICPGMLDVVWDHFDTRANVILGQYSILNSFDLQFGLGSQMPGCRSWLCKLPMKASSRMRSFCYACRCNFCMISGTLSFDLNFDLECQMPNQRCGCFNCPVRLAIS